MSWLLKTKMLNVTCFLLALFLFSPPVLAGKAGSYRFFKNLIESNSNQLKRIAKQIPDSSMIKKIDISTIKKSLPNIDVTKLSPDVLKLAAIGGQIARSGKFANRFINQAPNPAEIILQYSKYGKPYLKTAKIFSKTVVEHAGDLSKASAKQLKKFGNLSKDTIAKFKKEDFANTAFVSVLRRTGKKGYETIKKITKWAAKNPRKTGAAALLIWYSTNPEGFLDSVRNVGAFMTSFGTDTAGALVEGAGNGIVTYLTDMWADPVRQRSFFLGGMLLLGIIILSFRITRRLALFPLRAVGNKLNAYMDRKDKIANENKRKQQKINKVKNANINKKKTSLESSPGKPQNNEAKGLF